jgi:hypothetical protein
LCKGSGVAVAGLDNWWGGVLAHVIALAEMENTKLGSAASCFL